MRTKERVDVELLLKAISKKREMPEQIKISPVKKVVSVTGGGAKGAEIF